MQVTASRVNPRVVFSVVLSLALAVACVLPSYAHAGVLRDSNNLFNGNFVYDHLGDEYRCYFDFDQDNGRAVTLEPGTYTFNAQYNDQSNLRCFILLNDGQYSEQSNISLPYTFTLDDDYSFGSLIFFSNDENVIKNLNISHVMLNAGSTALPYEPYGEQVLDLSGILPDFLQFWTDSLRVVLPAALGLFGVIFGIRLAVRKFRTVV